MRSNGLPAARFDVLRDVDQLVSARLLQLLAEAGIAAYARQRANAVDPTRFDIVDRLWVDATRRAEAAQLVDEHLPDISALLDRDDDAAFEAIVAGWDDDGGTSVGSWPAQEDIDPSDTHGEAAGWPGEDEGAGEGAGDVPVGARRRLIRAAAAEPPPPVAAPAEEPDDHFVPPSPPPLPRLDKATAVALGGLVLGVVVLFGIWLLNLHVEPILSWLALFVALTGGVSLIYRMGDKLPPEEAGPDDGAVV